MSLTVPNDPSEREPEPTSWVPVAWCQDFWHSDHAMPDRPCPTCGQTDRMDASTSDWVIVSSAIAPAYDTSVVHYDLDNVDLVPENDSYSTDPAAVDCPQCAATLGDGQLTEDAAPDGWTTTPGGYAVPADLDDDPRLWTGEPMDRPADETVIAPAAPERRTVGLEVLTDELRALAEAERTAEAAQFKRKPDPIPAAARVAVVAYVNEAPVGVPDVDTDWRDLPGAVALAVLMHQAMGLAEQFDAELLMPGVDVLGALSGNLWAGFTASVESRWGLVQPGWWVSVETLDRDADPDVEWALVDDRDECHDPDCVVRRGEPSWACAVTTVQGRGVQHLDAFRAVYVRIPADTAVQA